MWYNGSMGMVGNGPFLVRLRGLGVSEGNRPASQVSMHMLQEEEDREMRERWWMEKSSGSMQASGGRMKALLSLLLVLVVVAEGASVEIGESQFSTSELLLLGDAFINGEGNLEMTKDSVIAALESSVGRALYRQPVRIFDPLTGHLASFSTNFQFRISNTSQEHGDGLAFVLVPDNSSLGSYGGWLGVLNATSDGQASSKTLAVEMDTYQNGAPILDPDSNHIAIDLNQMHSLAVANSSTIGFPLLNSNTIKVWVEYDSSLRLLQVSASRAVPPAKPLLPLLSLPVDLSLHLNPLMYAGFAAATGGWIQIHTILSWSFTSSLPPLSPAASPAAATTTGRSCRQVVCGRGLVVALSSGVGGVVAVGVGVCLCQVVAAAGRRRRKEGSVFSDSEYVKGGPRKFSYRELCAATKDFSPKVVVGAGGSGSVYMGVLACGSRVAVKKIWAGSRWGRREFEAELSIISQLRHRNLVPLRGWCSAKGHLLLVYDYMPNGSLDRVLFAETGCGRSGGSGKEVDDGLLGSWRRRESGVATVTLEWERRYRIVGGVATALAYLHEEWEQRVVHRDVKASNVMLDAAFNARLGDFGLARATDHSRNPETTVIVGTFGYLAPECTHTGKATDKTDVFSFGAVALEVACGRRPVERDYPAAQVVLVDWVWSLYKQARILDAADARLHSRFDPLQMATLLHIGLACSHPDPAQRPSMRHVLHILSGDAACLPDLPPSKPPPLYPGGPLTMQDIIAQLDYMHTSSAAAAAAAADEGVEETCSQLPTAPKH